MKLSDFKNEIRNRLLIKKNELIMKLYQLTSLNDRLAVVGELNTAYNQIIIDIATENKLDLNQQVHIDETSSIIAGSVKLELLIKAESNGDYLEVLQEIFEETKRIN